MANGAGGSVEAQRLADCYTRFGVFAPGLCGALGALDALRGGAGESASHLPVVGGVIGAERNIATALWLFANPQNWLRVGEALAGGVLILLGVLVLVWNTKAGEAARDVAPAAVAAGAGAIA